MIDSFVLLTPILMLPVVALLAFVGCNWLYGIEETDLAESGPGPTNLRATPGNAKVILEWDPFDEALEYYVKRGETSGVYDVTRTVRPENPGEVPPNTITDPALNGTTYFYVVTVLPPSPWLQSLPSNEVETMPTSAALVDFVMGKVLGTIVPSATGFFGMAIRVGTSPVTVQTLGRAFAPGNTQIHVIKIVDAAGVDVPNAFTSVSMAGGTPGEFRYGLLPTNPPIVLAAGATYYIVSQEISGGDAFYNHNTMVTTTDAGIVTGSVRGAPYVVDATGKVSYGPVNFQY